MVYDILDLSLYVSLNISNNNARSFDAIFNNLPTKFLVLLERYMAANNTVLIVLKIKNNDSVVSFVQSM